MVKSPVVANVTTQLFSFASASQGYVHSFPALAGRRFDELPYYFHDATLLGLNNPATGELVLNPPGDLVLTEDDQLVMMRPTSFKHSDYEPSSAPYYGKSHRQEGVGLDGLAGGALYRFIHGCQWRKACFFPSLFHGFPTLI